MIRFLLRMLPFILIGAGIASEGLGIPRWLKWPLIVAGGGLFIWYMWLIRKALAEHDAKEKEKPLRAIVMLLNRLPQLSEATLIKAVENALNFRARHGDDDDQGGHRVVVAEPTTIIMAPQGNFLIHRFDRPYFDGGSASAMGLRERRQQIVVEKNKAWMSVDCIGSAPGQSDDMVFADLARLAGRLAPDDCLGLYRPDTLQLVPFEPAMKKPLCDGVWAGVLVAANAPVINMPDDDPRMQAAQAEARRRFAEFVSAFENRRPDQIFSAKARFDEGEATEFMWVKVEAIEHDVIYGRLDNAPAAFQKLKANDRVRIPANEINDWLYTEGQELKGGFTVKVIQEAMKEEAEESNSVDKNARK